MTATARTLALTALLIAATSTAPAGAAAWPNGMSLNGMGLNGMGLNGMSVNGLSVNGLTVNGLTVNALHPNGVRNNALHVNGLGGSAACEARQLPCAQPHAEADNAHSPFQGRSAKPLGDVGAAGSK